MSQYERRCPGESDKPLAGGNKGGREVSLNKFCPLQALQGPHSIMSQFPYLVI